MRVLLAVHNCYTDPTNGAMRSLRTLMRWLAAAGHPTRVLATTRFETPVDFTVAEHMGGLGVPVAWDKPRRHRGAMGGLAASPVVARYSIDGVPVTTLLTRLNRREGPQDPEAHAFVQLLEETFADFVPDLLLSFGGRPLVYESLRRARARGVATVFSLRNFGYEDRRLFRDVAHAFTCSPFLSEHYHRAIGLRSRALESPIDWSEVEAPADDRAFLTYVNPSFHKGAGLFVRLAGMLGARRPDIPVLIVQASRSAAFLTSVPDIDFRRYPQILVSPAVPRPADYFALTRALVVPSVFAEPFGRVAAEAMINGVPVLVSDRGNLPRTIGADTDAPGGMVLPLPDRVAPDSPKVATEAEAAPWFEAVCRLWDDPELCARLGRQGRALAEQRYAEAELRRRHLEYLTMLDPADPLFAAPAACP